MITISNINEKWEDIKSKLSSNTIKVVNNASFLDLANEWEDIKEFADDETKELINKLLKMINDDLSKAEEPKKEPKEKKTPKPKKEPKAKEPKAKKEKKEFSGEYVESMPIEVAIIQRYSKLNGKSVSKVKDEARKILNALQKAIIEKKIRKTSSYADIIMKIQKNLISILDAKGSVTIDIENIDTLKEICKDYKVMPNVQLIKSYIAIQGKERVKDKAKILLSKVEKSSDTHYQHEFDIIKKSLENYINDKTDTPEISAQALAGLYGLAGIETTYTSGKAVGSQQFLGSVFSPLNFSGKWLKLIGQPSEPFKLMIYGKAGSGKSTLALQFAKYIASSQNKKVLYVAHEEGFSYTLQEKMRRLNLADKNLSIIDTLPNNFNGYDYVFIDSINSLGLEAEDLRKMNKDKSYVYIFQSTKDGNFRGSQEFEHDVDTSILVENMIAVARKNRFGGKESVSV
ncbi:MAG: AAA family ATPase [Bacteroidales bacterium]|nr:AAA family ATPase [Bacteroidales bacterium]